MAISRSSTDPPPEDNATGPGRRLREARIAREIDIGEIAARLHLHVNIIERIEADDYEHLPAPTFVRGYLRGYARLLDVKPDAIVAAYDTHHFDPPPLVRDISNSQEVKSTDFSFRLATYSIVAVVVILVAIWWQNQESGVPITTTPAETTAEGTTAGGPEPGAEAGLPAETPAHAADVDSVTVSPQTERIAPGPAGEAMPPGATPGSSPIEQTAEVTPSATQPPEATPQAGEDAHDDGVIASAATEIPPAPPAQSVETGPRLRISVGEESWIEVHDRDETRLYYDLARAGSVINIEEDGPLRVLLGNTSDVQVELRGEAFDVGPYTDAGVARFELPAASN